MLQKLLKNWDVCFMHLVDWELDSVYVFLYNKDIIKNEEELKSLFRQIINDAVSYLIKQELQKIDNDDNIPFLKRFIYCLLNDSIQEEYIDKCSDLISAFYYNEPFNNEFLSKIKEQLLEYLYKKNIKNITYETIDKHYKELKDIVYGELKKKLPDIDLEKPYKLQSINMDELAFNIDKYLTSNEFTEKYGDKLIYLNAYGKHIVFANAEIYYLVSNTDYKIISLEIRDIDE